MTSQHRRAPLPAALLFDMDGLLVDTETIWHIGEHRIMAELGFTWTAELGAQLVGGPIPHAAQQMAAAAGWVITAQELEDRLVELMVELLATETINWRPGARELLTAASAADLPCALVSNSYRRLVNAVLTALAADLGHVPFSTTVAADELRAGKPSPEPYLVAAARLEARPEDCVVLEDSEVGVQAGLAAGCRVVAVPSEVPVLPRPRLTVRDSLVGLTLADLPALFED